ncbi:type II secretion system protein N [bacterium SCSIO 12696]|nr:type II secretion system protein N [bacterium SCSIO 12696]
MKRFARWLWCLPLLLLVNFVVQAPARLLESLLPQELAFQASSYQGSLWKGRAQQVVTGSDGAYVNIDTVQWTLHPLSLLSLSPSADVVLEASGSEFLSGEVQWLGGQRLGASDLEVSLPAVTVGHYAGSYPLAGQLSLRLEKLVLDGSRVEELAGNGSWQNARVDIGGRWFAMGTLAGDLAMQGNSVQLSFFDLSGPVDLDGQLLFNPSGTTSVDALVGLPPQTDDDVVQRLSLFAERQPDGKYHIEFEY